jgi:aminoglycoside phosphotransferase family enzyme/predicted kinase
MRAQEKIDLRSWRAAIEQLRSAPEWAPEDLPVELIQTHISALLLGRKHVVKLKKPVDFGFLDYTTLEKRRRACEDEVRLNRRLCPDTYLGVGSIVELDRRLRFSGRGGTIVDYCVWMKRLPADLMLDRLVACGQVTEEMLDLVAGKLAQFHASARRGPDVARWGSPGEIRRNWAENFEQTESFIGRTISDASFRSIGASVDEWLARPELFERRVREGHIVDGHGDVRCESICVKDNAICIYDCIEFNDRFRCDDVASEVAFLAMDLDARGRPDLGYFFTASYGRRTDDKELVTLLPFYRCYRAYVRGKVLSFRLNEAEFSKEERDAAAKRSSQYFELARRYASRLRCPAVIVVGGLSGTGKTSVARAIAGELGLRVISSDAVRQSLFGLEKRPAGYGKGVYTVEANQLTYQTMIKEARERLSEDGAVVLDATFQRAGDKAAAREMAQAAGAQWRMIECRSTPEVVRARLAARAERGDGHSDAGWEIYLRQQAEGGAEHTGIEGEYLPVDTTGSLSAIARNATDWLR